LDFSFSAEQDLFRKAVREFCSKEISPVSRQMESQECIPDSVISGLARMGLFGLSIPAEYGGSDAGAIAAGIAGEEIGKADMSCSVAVLYLVPVAWSHVLARFGSSKLKQTVLPKLSQGQSFLGIATTEAGMGSDLANTATTATRAGDDYVLNGEKLYISGVREATEQMPEGGGYVVLARTDPEKGAKGLSLFYVPVKNVPGITVTYLKEMGRRGMSAGGIRFNDVRIPAENRIGEENKGFVCAMEGFDLARAIISVVCVGAALGALDAGIEYIKQRKAFGQPIGKFEGVQFKLAENFALLEALRFLGYRALWMYERAEKDTTISRFEVGRCVAEAKMLAPVVAFQTMNDVLQWFGAFGYTLDCPIEMGLRGVRSYMLAEGTTEIMKIIVARELLGKEFVAYR